MGDGHDPQARARQIRAFRDECDLLEREGVFAPSAQQRAAIDGYHARLLASLARQFDIDLTETQHSLSLGLRLATLIAAVALSAATILLLRRVWGWLVLPAQVSVAIIACALAFAALDWSARASRRARLTGILAAVAFASTVANLEIFGAALGYAPSPVALLTYGIVGIALAYGYGSRVTLVAGALCVAVFVMSIPVTMVGGWWTEAPRRPESAIIVGIGCLAASSIGGKRHLLAPWWRATGCVLIGLALLMLSLDGTLTWLPAFGKRAVEVAYVIAACLIGLTTIVAGARRRWLGVSAGGAILIGAVLVTQYVAHWSHDVPQWLFFLSIGAAALGVGAMLAWMRRSGEAAG